VSLDKIAQLRLLIIDLEAEVMKTIDDGATLEEAGNMLLHLNLTKRDMGIVYDTVAHRFGEMMDMESAVPLPGNAIIEKKSSYERKAWQHKDLAKVVVDRLTQMAVDMDTGEVVKSPEDIAMELMTYCAPSYWRIKELNNIGINPDMYCETGVLKTSIIVRKGDTE
jgi:hypothetical protein